MSRGETRRPLRYRGFSWVPPPGASLSIAVLLGALTGFFALVVALEVIRRVEGDTRPRWLAIALTTLILGVLASATRGSWRSWLRAARVKSGTSGAGAQSLGADETVNARVGLAGTGKVFGGGCLIVAGFVLGAVARRHKPIGATRYHLASGLSHTGYDALVVCAWALIIFGFLLAIVGLIGYWAIQTR
jgi:hypothetical protein